MQFKTQPFGYQTIMAKTLFLCLLYPFLLSAFLLKCYSHEDDKVYVVYMGDCPKEDVSITSMHHDMLSEVLGSGSFAKESLMYSYKRSFNGFAARLSEEEVARISEMKGVVSVLPNTLLQLHTTRSWEFLGLAGSQPRKSYEGDAIIGMIDTGIWPENESFSDEGFGPPPAKWKGKCQSTNNFTCNRKIIGARFYNIENKYDEKYDVQSPRDSDGHGSHTASTAAGRAVDGASYYGQAKGVARGGVPNARIAVYKVCWWFGCGLADVLAAFDDAIADGVDIISVSLGPSFALRYFEDPIAIGSFHAMRNGILTSSSAGNSGPFPRSVTNHSPWLLTVAASTIDRKFTSKLVLGNGQIFTGNAINVFDLNGTSFPLIWGGDAANVSIGASSGFSSVCFPTTLSSKIEGKIVLCDVHYDGSAIKLANGLGIIMRASLIELAFSYPVPATVISWEDHDKIKDYIKSTDNPIANILVSETSNNAMAPRVASFSARGPNIMTPDILKPDLTAPGVDILAAWSPLGSPSTYIYDERSVEYNIISGTSMSCPHATGAAVYVKAAHPSWSPAAIKSALMTTASIMDPKKNEDAEFAYGSGHINPVKAVNPGLVFDASEADYVDFLCKQGYNTTLLRLVTGDSSVCSSTKHGKAWDLNYPSFALSITDGEQIMGTFTRTVTNVGSPNSTYYSSVSAPSSLSISVNPSVLIFSAAGEKKSFRIEVYGPQIAQVPIISGAIEWTDGTHVVRSPLAVYTNIPSHFSSENTTPTKNPNSIGGVTIYQKNEIVQGN